MFPGIHHRPNGNGSAATYLFSLRLSYSVGNGGDGYRIGIFVYRHFSCHIKA